jgi:hypothetical protein
MWANHLVVVERSCNKPKKFHFNKFQPLQRSTTPREKECTLRVLGVHNSNSMHFHFVCKCIFSAPKDPPLLERKCNLRVLGVHNFNSMHFHFVWKCVFTFLENIKAQPLFQTNPLGLDSTLVMSPRLWSHVTTSPTFWSRYIYTCVRVNVPRI